MEVLLIIVLGGAGIILRVWYALLLDCIYYFNEICFSRRTLVRTVTFVCCHLLVSGCSIFVITDMYRNDS